MHKRKNVLFSLLITGLLMFKGYAQNVGIGTQTPASSARLHISDTAKGLLIPRLTQTQRNGISSPATGLLVYQTDNNAGLYYYDGTQWSRFLALVQSDTTLTGDGTLTNPLRLGRQGAATGEILKWNGTNWSPAPDSGGLPSVNTTLRLSGDGTNSNPLDIAQQGASSGQVLEWNGSSWVPATDDTAALDNYVQKTGDTMTGNLNMSQNQLISARLEIDSTPPVPCNTTNIGYVYLDTSSCTKGFMGCNGSIWVRLSGGQIGTKNCPAKSCYEILDKGFSKGSGTYWLDPDGGDTSNAFRAYCDMTTNGGGWTRLWFKQDHTDGFGFVSCETNKWGSQWSSSPVLDIDPDCDSQMEDDWYDLTYYDEDGNTIPASQISALSGAGVETVYSGQFYFNDPDNNCDGGRQPVTTYDNSGPSGNSLNIFPTQGTPASDVSHIVCGGSNGTVAGAWRTIDNSGIPTAFGLQSGTDATGCWKCAGYTEGYGSTIEFKETYFWIK